MSEIRRTIREVLDTETGEYVKSLDFFKNDSDEIFRVRYLQEQAKHNHGEPKFICYHCFEVLEIRGGIIDGYQKKIFFFQHPSSGEECPLKMEKKTSAKEILRRKFHGQKEGIPHKTLKGQIAHYLNLNKTLSKGVSEIKVEKIVRGKFSDTWKKPDVQAVYEDKRLVFEIQLSTTFISVIEERQSFYQNENVFIIWVLKYFQNDDDLRKFTENDVIYSNKQNAFILDNEALSQCEEKQDLVVKAYFKKYTICDGILLGEWKYNFVTLDMISFDSETKKSFYFDSDSDKEKVNLLLVDVKKLYRSKAKVLSKYYSKLTDLKSSILVTKGSIQEIEDNIKMSHSRLLEIFDDLRDTYQNHWGQFQELKDTIQEYKTMFENLERFRKSSISYQKIKNFDSIPYNTKQMSVISAKDVDERMKTFLIKNKADVLYQVEMDRTFRKSTMIKLSEITDESALNRIMEAPHIRFLYCFEENLKTLQATITKTGLQMKEQSLTILYSFQKELQSEIDQISSEKNKKLLDLDKKIETLLLPTAIS